MAYVKFRPRRGTLFQWSSINPILEEGELAIEFPEAGIGTGLSKMKLGDGIRKYTELPYALDGATAAKILGGGISEFNLIVLRAGTGEQWKLANPILADGELAYDKTSYSIKIGDGIKAWNELDYIHAGNFVGGEVDFGDEDAVESVEENLEYVINNDGE